MTAAISASSALASNQVMADVGIAVAKKALDQARQQGDAVATLLESAAQTQKTAVARGLGEPHKGTMIDVVA